MDDLAIGLVDDDVLGFILLLEEGLSLIDLQAKCGS